MQRVRVGLTGLSCVFLLVLLAAAFFGLAPADRNVTDRSILANAADNASNADDPKDPLAELGVTPGGGQTEPALPAPAPQTAPAPLPTPATTSPAPQTIPPATSAPAR